MQSKGLDSPEHFKGETELIFGLFKRYSFSPPTSKYNRSTPGRMVELEVNQWDFQMTGQG